MGNPGDYSYDAGSCQTSFSTTYSGSTLGSGAHTFHVYGYFGSYANSRQWFLNVGQYGTGAEHWLWNGNNNIQWGAWNVRRPLPRARPRLPRAPAADTPQRDDAGRAHP